MMIPLKEVSTRFGLTKSSLYALKAKGMLKTEKRGGGVYFDEAEISEILELNTIVRVALQDFYYEMTEDTSMLHLARVTMKVIGKGTLNAHRDFWSEQIWTATTRTRWEIKKERGYEVYLRLEEIREIIQQRENSPKSRSGKRNEEGRA